MVDKFIRKIHLKNFKGFRERVIDEFHEGVNVLIGDNDTGKSSVLLAVDLVLGANPNRVESIGLDKLLNQQVVDEFLASTERKFEDLPHMQIDLYLNDQGSHEFEGNQNIAENETAYGIHLKCVPRHGLYDDITKLISSENPAFPYEYYSIEIKGFGGRSITPYSKPMQHISIDNTKISNDYASRSYVQSLYHANVDDTQKSQLRYGYRHMKENFAREQFDDINKEIEEGLGFSLKNNSKTNLETDLTISKEGIDIENLGVGHQCFIRTKFALSKKSTIDVVLLEEPENHLSHTKMRQLIDEIKEASQSQIFVATHSSLVSSRLDLRHAILFGPFNRAPVRLSDLPDDTADYFMKAPSSAVLEFVLSEKSILVEGDAEYILMEPFYHSATRSNLFGSGINVIAIGGISFPRYLDIAKLLGTKTAVITDNDGDIQTKCVDRYSDYEADDNIQVFYDSDEARSTFEICVYHDNPAICEDQFSEGRRTLTVQEFMLNNKAHAAHELARHRAAAITAPQYISDAITWLNS